MEMPTSWPPAAGAAGAVVAAAAGAAGAAAGAQALMNTDRTTSIETRSKKLFFIFLFLFELGVKEYVFYRLIYKPGMTERK